MNRLFSAIVNLVSYCRKKVLAGGKPFLKMKEVNSNSNKNYKLCLQLTHKKYRDQYGLYLIEGDHLLAEAIKRDIELQMVFIREDRVFQENDAFPESIALSEKLFKNIAQTESSQGVIAVARKKNWSEALFFEQAAGKNILVLDRLQDPGNIGTMIRTADAAGYGGAIILKGTGDIYNPKVVRAAAGSLFRLPVIFVETPEDALRMLKRHGKKTVSTGFDTDYIFYDEDLKRDIALLIGNEGSGICEELSRGADVKVKIPMENNVNSLSAPVAAAILMYESKRKG